MDNVLEELKEIYKNHEVLKDLKELFYDSYNDDEMNTKSILYALIFMENLKELNLYFNFHVELYDDKRIVLAIYQDKGYLTIYFEFDGKAYFAHTGKNKDGIDETYKGKSNFMVNDIPSNLINFIKRHINED